MSDTTDNHLAAIKEAMENTWTGDDEGYVVVIAHATELAKQLAEAERQRDWHRDDAAMVRRERDDAINRLARERDDERARADRFRELADRNGRFAERLAMMLTNTQVAHPDYPAELERQASIAYTACWKAGDLPDAPGDAT